MAEQEWTEDEIERASEQLFDSRWEGTQERLYRLQCGLNVLADVLEEIVKHCDDPVEAEDGDSSYLERFNNDLLPAARAALEKVRGE